jgi:hypothetical protein
MTAEDPTRFNLPDAELLKPRHVDNVARALLSLTREVCVLTDRLLVLERVLEEQGLDVAAHIDRHQPDEALQRRIDAMTGQIVRSVVAALEAREASGA